MAPRKILHLDLDAFFCAVEELLHPDLKGKVFAVGGSPDQRGVVSSCSYPARKFGVRSAMPMARAKKICPELIVVRGNYQEYSIASEKTMDILRDCTPLVEQVSIDEAFLDVSDLPESGREIALQLQARIMAEVGLPCSIGVASNKLVAKIANNLGKSGYRGDGPPRAINVVKPGEEAAFLAPLPAGELWGIGPKTAARLHNMGIETIGDLAKLSESWLLERFGQSGVNLYRHSRGIDDRPVVTSHDTKSISNEVTFSQDVSNEAELKACLRRLSDKVGRRLRKANFMASTVRVKLRYADFSTYSRQITFETAIDQDQVIYEAAVQLFDNFWKKENPVRLLGVGVSTLQDKLVQLSLWETKSDRERRLLTALDALRDRFGGEVVQRATRLKK